MIIAKIIIYFLVLRCRFYNLIDLYKENQG